MATTSPDTPLAGATQPAASPAEPPAAVPPIWELAAAVRATVPDAAWGNLPSDLARRFDEYQRARRRSVADLSGQ